MAYTTINKSSDYFNGTAYTGNGTAGRDITLATFQPDFTWIKSRSDTDNHRLVDAVRGATKHLQSDTTDAEQTSSNVTAFTSDGVTLSSNGAVNANSETYMSWNWLGANGTTANTAGSINSTVSANTTAGFSISSYTGTGSAGATVGHGLGTTPSMIIVKNRSATGNWSVYHKDAFTSQSSPGVLYLNQTAAKNNSDVNVWGNSSVTINSTVFSLGDYSQTNGSGNSHIAYCFAEKQGYSKFGSYTGNGNADGTFVYTGFKPAFVMIKRTDTGDNWLIKDIKRDPINQMEKRIFPNLSNAEDTGSGGNYDFLSNGFKLRESDAIGNASGGTYIYMAFAEAPLVGTNNVPCTAR